MKIQILGPGCARCKKLAENAEMAANDLGLDYTLEKITDIDAIMRFKVWQTPGLVVDGVVKSTGRLLSMEEIKKLLA
ncbi:thioredoxin family protein [candidate division KSB1 bacterium]|nr:MAG: thioredoxin family protein [candidate division KSB1 bacterium]